MGPTVQVMPGHGKSFDAFQADQATCKSFASDQVKGQADAANERAIGTAVLTTALGAGLGAATGNLGGQAGQGAAIGGAAGSVMGTGLAAAQTSQADQPMIQAQYDTAYSQCMYSKGNLVPGMAPQPMVASGMAGPDPALVRSIQVELGRLSYLNARPDGEAGPMTRGAIRKFEKAHGMRADGAPTQAVLAKLQSTPTSAGAAPAATASAPANWVAPGSAPPTGATLTPAASTTPASPPGWVAPPKGQ